MSSMDSATASRVPTVLVVDDEATYRALYRETLAAAGFRVIEAPDAETALVRIAASPPDLVVSDIRMPGASGLELLQEARTKFPALPFVLVTAYGDVRDAVDALKLGAVDYLTKPVDLAELTVSVQDALGVRAHASLDDPPAALTEGIIAASPAMRALLREAWLIARGDVSVLIGGESGSGKEVLARFLHRASGRAGGPFVALNCAALPESLAASELFGHERGAFTGAATARKGRFREAERGVLFLDEIGELPLQLQPIFLRALENRTITPVGGTGEVPVDFRLVAATNVVLEDAVAAGTFRADLFYRLNVVSLEVPALRDRPEDIVPLARHFLAVGGDRPMRLARGTQQLLEAYHWPGNVRELANAMTRARLLTRTDVVLPEALPPALRAPQPAVAAPPEAVAAPPEGVQTLRDNEIASLKHALETTGDNRTKAAALLGISRRGLLKKLKRFDL